MTTFDAALLEEEKWLAHLRDQPFPPDGHTFPHGLRVYIGPTAVDLSPIADAQARANLLALTQRLEAESIRNERIARGHLRARSQTPRAQQFY